MQTTVCSDVFQSHPNSDPHSAGGTAIALMQARTPHGDYACAGRVDSLQR
jgi:hypothetical protein